MFRSTILTIGIALGLSSGVQGASNRLPAHNPAKVSAKIKANDACFYVEHNGKKYIVTENMDQRTGIVSNYMWPKDLYRDLPRKCHKGQNIHQYLVSIFYR